MANLIDGYYYYDRVYVKKDGTATNIIYRTKKREPSQGARSGRKKRVFTEEEKREIMEVYNLMNKSHTYTVLYLKAQGFNISKYYLKQILEEEINQTEF